MSYSPPFSLWTYFNPRTPCGVRRGINFLRFFSEIISIHAPLAGCDGIRDWILQPPSYFNPRTPCGVRPSFISPVNTPLKFQSTHPLRGATVKGYLNGRRCLISIHAPLAGCDSMVEASGAFDAIFQSTHPLRGATPPSHLIEHFVGISIHAPLAGCDNVPSCKVSV